MPTHRPRTLAVILHADVVGSTALVQRDETLAHARIQDAFHRFSQTIAAYGGTAHEIRGDALVAEFARASDAASATLCFQSANQAHNEGLTGDVRPELRVGISLGEVVIADGTVTGAGVVLAQRLEQLAVSGGVVVQGTVSETVPERLPFCYETLGEQTLKGFDQPVRAFRLTLKPGEQVPEPEAGSISGDASAPDDGVTDAPALELPDRPSIAVLPFTNMSGDPEQEYFSDGITEDIITALSHISGLLVVARNSTAVYKDQAVAIKQVGREQGVRYVLEGSVRKGGNRVRVTAQLIDATTGHHQWAEHYDRELDNIFEVQDEITQKVTLEMRVQLKHGEQARLRVGGTQSVKARELALRADELADRHIREDHMEARRLAEEALTIDPAYAHAWVALGWTHWEDGYWGWSESPEASLEQALQAGQKALQIDESHADAYAMLGVTHLLRHEYDEALAMGEKSACLAPSHADAHALWAFTFNGLNKPREAIQRMRRAMRLCPNYPAWYLLVLADAHRLLGEPQVAVSTLREAVAQEPDSALSAVWLANIMAEAGLLDEARAAAQKVLDIDPTFTLSRGIAGLCYYKDPALNERAMENMRRAGLPE